MTAPPRLAGADAAVVETASFHVSDGRVALRPGTPVDNDLADAIPAELGPLGLVPDRAAFERIFTGLVEGSAPDPDQAWDAFYAGTLAGLQDPGRRGEGSVAAFGRIYAQVVDRVCGGSVLDLGSCFGFLPLLVALARPQALVVGSDRAVAPVALARRIAASRRSTAQFLCADAVRLPFPDRSFDTVTAVHLLEHLPARAGGQVLAESRRVARSRVLVAVPVEPEPDPAYGHLRAFTPATLAAQGAGHPDWATRGWSGDGAWLQLDRIAAASAD